MRLEEVMASKTSPAAGSGVFDEAVETFNEAVKAGAKVQDEIGKWWSDALDKAGPAEDWQKKSKAVFSEAIPAAQKNGEEWLKLVEQNYKRSLGLFKKAWDVQPSRDPAVLRAKSQELWEASLELVRDNAQAVAQANVKLMEIWGRVLRNGAENGKTK
jgi:hypothetical protein